MLRNRYIQALSSSKGADETVDIGVLSGRYDIEDLERPLLLSMIEQSMLSALESIKYLGEEERLLEFEKDQLEQGIDPSKVPADEVVVRLCSFNVSFFFFVLPIRMNWIGGPFLSSFSGKTMNFVKG